MKGFLWLVAVAIAASAGWYFFGAKAVRGASTRSMFRTAKVERGEVVEGVAASGTVQPVVLVQVGTQVSGVIEKLFVDFNSKVTAGQTIALVDSRRMAAQIAQDEAAVARAKADLERIRSLVIQARSDVERTKAVHASSQADVERVRALLTQAEHDLERQKTLVDRKLTSPADYDAALATKGSFTAQLASAEAAVRQNEAQIAVAEATVHQDEAQVAVGEAAINQAAALLTGDRVNLDYATIVSPVDGVVVSRNVDVGQTVASSLQAPTLFLIAQDLTKVQVQTSVPEADVGKVHQSQKVHFTVDAYSDKTFDGAVSQVRLASTTVSNVVTYTVIVDASNPDGLLFPGMTANVVFEIAHSDSDALRVPATALRLQPPADLLETPTTPAKPEGAREGAREGGRQGGKRGGGAAKPKSSFVYATTPDNRLRAIAVVPGLSDGIFTVVTPAEGATLDEGLEIATAVLREEEPATTNPFAPPRMGGGGRGVR